MKKARNISSRKKTQTPLRMLMYNRRIERDCNIFQLQKSQIFIRLRCKTVIDCCRFVVISRLNAFKTKTNQYKSGQHERKHQQRTWRGHFKCIHCCSIFNAVSMWCWLTYNKWYMWMKAQNVSQRSTIMLWISGVALYVYDQLYKV